MDAEQEFFKAEHREAGRLAVLESLLVSPISTEGDPGDPDDRGAFAALLAPGVIDGTIADVYGETAAEARDLAQALADAGRLAAAWLRPGEAFDEFSGLLASAGERLSIDQLAAATSLLRSIRLGKVGIR